MLGSVFGTDFVFFDKTGTSTTWYELCFYNTAKGVESDYSVPIQASLIGTYATVKKVFEFMNWYNEIFTEIVATATTTQTLFPLANHKVVEGSLKVYVDGTIKAFNDDYTVDYETGRVTFAVAPGNGKVVTADYWWADYSSRIVSDCIQRAQAEIDQTLGRTFYGVTSVTQKYNGNSFDIDNWFNYESQSFTNLADEFRPKQADYQNEKTLLLNNFPVIAISAFTIGADSIDAAAYDLLTSEGIIILKEDYGYLFTKGSQNVSITYTYGYTEVPKLVEELCIKLTVQEVLRSRLLGMPNTSLDVPLRHIATLRQETDDIYQALGRRLTIKVI